MGRSPACPFTANPPDRTWRAVPPRQPRSHPRASVCICGEIFLLAVRHAAPCPKAPWPRHVGQNPMHQGQMAAILPRYPAALHANAKTPCTKYPWRRPRRPAPRRDRTRCTVSATPDCHRQAAEPAAVAKPHAPIRDSRLPSSRGNRQPRTPTQRPHAPERRLTSCLTGRRIVSPTTHRDTRETRPTPGPPHRRRVDSRPAAAITPALRPPGFPAARAVLESRGLCSL
jgi:hypothetical protein